jgi:CBS domain-containing protein
MPIVQDILDRKGRDVVSVESTDSVLMAARLMNDRGIGGVVVTEGGRVVGIFTERDVLRAAASGSDLTRSPVSRWMTRDPETVGPHVDSERAAEIMLGSGFRHLPVVAGTALVGIVSLRDLLSLRVRRRPS